MTPGRLVASAEQSWGWNLGIAEPQLHPCSSPALSQNMDKALREFREAKPSSFSLSLEFSLNPTGQGCVLQLPSTHEWNVLEDLEHTGNLQDKTSNHRKRSVPIQTKKIRKKKEKKDQSSHIQKCHFRNSICHI